MIRCRGKKGHTARTATQTAVIMMVLTLVSKIFGFARELVVADTFGAGQIADAYVMSQTIPGVLFSGLFAAIGTAYMPLFSGVVEKQGKREGNRFTNQVVTFGFLIAIAGIILGIVFSDALVQLFAGQFSEDTAHLTSVYLKFTLGYNLFVCANGVLTAYLQYNGDFIRPIIAGYLYDAGIIGVVLLAAVTSHYLLAMGLLAGYAFQFFALYRGARRLEYRYRPDFQLNKPVRQIMGLALPVFIGSYVGQINSFVDKVLAAGLREGTISGMSYAFTLMTVISSLIIGTISTIMYPKITKAITNGEWEYFNVVGKKSLAVTIMIGLPFGLGAMAFSQQIIQVIYERGAFEAAATALAGSSFLYYGLCVLFLSLNSLLTQLYYSMRNMKTPVICSAVSVVVNVVLNLVLVDSMAHRGLALATSISMGVNTLLLLILLRKRHPEARVLPGFGKILRICIASVIAVGIAILVYQLLQAVWMPRLCYLVIAVGASVLVYLPLLKLFKIEELDVLKELIRR